MIFLIDNFIYLFIVAGVCMSITVFAQLRMMTNIMNFKEARLPFSFSLYGAFAVYIIGMASATGGIIGFIGWIIKQFTV